MQMFNPSTKHLFWLKAKEWQIKRQPLIVATNCVKPPFSLPPPTSEEEKRKSRRHHITFENWPKKQECLLTTQVHPSSISVGAFTSEKPLFFSRKKLLENKKVEMASDSLSSSRWMCKIASTAKRPDDLLSIHRKANLDPAIWKSPQSSPLWEFLKRKRCRLWPTAHLRFFQLHSTTTLKRLHQLHVHVFSC